MRNAAPRLSEASPCEPLAFRVESNFAGNHEPGDRFERLVSGVGDGRHLRKCRDRRAACLRGHDAPSLFDDMRWAVEVCDLCGHMVNVA